MSTGRTSGAVVFVGRILVIAAAVGMALPLAPSSTGPLLFGLLLGLGVLARADVAAHPPAIPAREVREQRTADASGVWRLLPRAALPRDPAPEA
jgi:hypothetical protein